jgi:arsenite methyltransferase
MRKLAERSKRHAGHGCAARQILKALELKEREHVLDIGSGPVLMALDMAVSVGRNGHVWRIDISEDMLATIPPRDGRCGHGGCKCCP